MIALIDHEVGRILAALEEAGLAEDTLVVFSSDHGEMLGNHQQLLKGPQLYEDLTRVPLIARWPGYISPGITVNELVQWIDLPATFLDAASWVAIVDKHHARILSVEPEFTVIQKTGRREQTAALFDELKPFGILEFVRSGRVAISRPMKELKTYLEELKLASTH